MSDPIRRIGENKGSKRHLLADERGIPLSVIVTAANVNDSSAPDNVLKACVVKRPALKQRITKHLCADAGYYGKQATKVILASGYIPHVTGRAKERALKQRKPGHKARRWVVEVSHSWFKRFRKLLVRYEKLERSFVALNHLATAIIAARKVKLEVNIVYGSALRMV